MKKEINNAGLLIANSTKNARITTDKASANVWQEHVKAFLSLGSKDYEAAAVVANKLAQRQIDEDASRKDSQSIRSSKAALLNAHKAGVTVTVDSSRGSLVTATKASKTTAHNAQVEKVTKIGEPSAKKGGSLKADLAKLVKVYGLAVVMAELEQQAADLANAEPTALPLAM